MKRNYHILSSQSIGHSGAPNWRRVGYNWRKRCSDLLIDIVSREEEQWMALRVPKLERRPLVEEEIDRTATKLLQTRTGS